MANKKLSAANIKKILERVKNFLEITDTSRYVMATRQVGSLATLDIEVVSGVVESTFGVGGKGEPGKLKTFGDSLKTVSAVFPQAAKKLAALKRAGATLSLRKHGTKVIGLDVFTKGARPSIPGLEEDIRARTVDGLYRYAESQQATRRRHEKTVDKTLGAFAAGAKEGLRQRGIPANADGKPNASLKELAFLGPRTVGSIANLMRSGVGVQIGKRGLKVTVLRLRETHSSKTPKNPVIAGMKHKSTMVSKDRFTHTYVSSDADVKFGSF